MDGRAYCNGDGYPCNGTSPDGTLLLAPGWLNETRNVRGFGRPGAKVTETSPEDPSQSLVSQPSTAATAFDAAATDTSSTSPVRRSGSETECSSSSREKAETGAAVGVPLAVAFGGAQDIGGIANTQK